MPYMNKFKYVCFWVVSLTWGAIMTVIGLLTATILSIARIKPERCGPVLVYRFGRSWGGVSFGPVAVVCNHSGKETIAHECGHFLQNCIWGPLMPFVISIPSAIRYHYRNYLVKKGTLPWMLPDYDSIWFEGQATKWGEKITKKWYETEDFITIITKK